MRVLEACCIFEAVAKYSIHGAMAKQDDACKQNVWLIGVPANTDYDHRNTLVVEQIVKYGPPLVVQRITQHADIGKEQKDEE